MLSWRQALAGAVVVAALALVACSGSGESSAASRAAAAHPPVVLIAFDEFPTTSLVAGDGRVDAVRYPNFAQLAHDGDWFPYATSSVDETSRAMGLMLTGSDPGRGRKPTIAQMPRNLFTTLGRGGYRIHASEEVSSLCPKRRCRNVRPQNQRSVLHELGGGRPERVASWARGIKRGGRTLYFKHVLLPHVPLQYLPSGRHYTRPAAIEDHLLHAFNSGWPVTQVYQRHLLQLGFTDRLLGTVLDRLKRTGLYDKALIIVTADNGESFGRLGNRHEISTRNALDIALTPLFIKQPNQHAGRVVRRHVRTLDILPTIVHFARVRAPRMRGRSIYGPAARRIPSGVTMAQRSGRHIRLSYSALVRGARAKVRHATALFGSGTAAPGLFGIGPHPELHGKRLSSLHVVAASGLAAHVADRRAWSHVRLGGSLPLLVSGTLTGARADATHDLAFAVNGTVVARAPAFSLPGLRSRYFSAVVPESSLHEGANALDVLEITRGPAGTQLARLP